MNWLSVVLLVMLCTACTATGPVVDTNVKINFPPSSRIDSVEQADTVLAAVTLSRAQIEWRYQQKEQICYTHFFVNSCLLEAKDQRRVDLARVKKSEVEAKFFKRKKTVEEMDKALAEKNIQNPLPKNVTGIKNNP